MRKSALRRVFGAGASLALAAGIALTAAPAQASERPLDITGYKVSDITVTTSSCRKVSISATTSVKKDFMDSFGSVDVTRQGGLVDSLGFEGRKIVTRAEICPSWSGLGAYKVGPADLMSVYEYYDPYYGEVMGDYKTYTDRTSKTFYVRGKAKSSLTAKRSGKKVTLTAKAKVYSPENYGYGTYNAKQAKFQVKTDGKWKTLKTVNLKKGTAKLTIKQSKKKSYRLQVPQASWATAATSKTIKK